MTLTNTNLKEHRQMDMFGHEKIRTLGLYQPFATLMLHGKIETRWVRNGKKPPFPLGKYLIYSTKKGYEDEELKELCGAQYARAIALEEADDTAGLYGYGLCIGELVKIVDPLDFSYDEVAFIHVRPAEDFRLVGLVFTDVKRIKPFAFHGKQGIGFLSENELSSVEYL